MYVYIKTFGCQMNYHDSERIFSFLKDIGYIPTIDVNLADLIIFNTCAIRDLASKKFYSALGMVNKDKIIGVCGCVAQMDGENILKKYPFTDFVLGTDNIDAINETVLEVSNKKGKICKIDFLDSYDIRTIRFHKEHRGFINIIKGCDAFCSYCIVPTVRGRELSRDLKAILDDILKMESEGVKEITLLGQNVNAYASSNDNLATLIREIDKLKIKSKIKFVSAHPYYFTNDLINCFRDCNSLSNHLHLPLQSGSDHILNLMGRRYKAYDYIELVSKLREKRPSIVITTDMMVGFPGESEKDFNDSLELLKKIRFDAIYAYIFSKRKNTKAYSMESDLKKEEVKERLHIMQRVQKEIQSQIRSLMVGIKYLVLVDGYQEKSSSFFGRTDENRIIFFKGEDIKIGEYYLVEVTSSTAYSAKGIVQN